MAISRTYVDVCTCMCSCALRSRTYMYIRTFLEEKHMDNADVYADVMLGLTIADVYVVVGPYAFCRRSFTNVKGYPHAILF